MSFCSLPRAGRCPPEGPPSQPLSFCLGTGLPSCPVLGSPGKPARTALGWLLRPAAASGSCVLTPLTNRRQPTWEFGERDAGKVLAAGLHGLPGDRVRAGVHTRPSQRGSPEPASVTAWQGWLVTEARSQRWLSEVWTLTSSLSASSYPYLSGYSFGYGGDFIWSLRSLWALAK